jgi:hypothetical protein
LNLGAFLDISVATHIRTVLKRSVNKNPKMLLVL